MKNFNNLKGFTLVELLVVITIIGILAVGGLSLFAGAQQKARDSVRMTDMRLLLTTVEQMAMDRKGGEAEGVTSGCGEGRGYPAGVGSTTFADKVLKYGYLDRMPRDPNNGGRFKYRYVAAGGCVAYELSTRFEHPANGYKMEAIEDQGEDLNRYEVGTPNCLGGGSNETSCPDGTGVLNTSGESVTTYDIADPTPATTP